MATFVDIPELRARECNSSVSNHLDTSVNHGHRLYRTMPYATNSKLPPSVREHLPTHAQGIFREAFNHAFEQHSGDETTVFRIA